MITHQDLDIIDKHGRRIGIEIRRWREGHWFMLRTCRTYDGAKTQDSIHKVNRFPTEEGREWHLANYRNVVRYTARKKPPVVMSQGRGIIRKVNGRISYWLDGKRVTRATYVANVDGHPQR